MRAKRYAFWLVLVLAALAFATFGTRLFFPQRDQRLPVFSSVKSMTAELNSPLRPPNIPAFEVQPEDIAPVLQALEPAKREYFPPNWQILGDLKLTTHEGREVEVHLFWTGTEKGAFAVGPWGRQVYYR